MILVYTYSFIGLAYNIECLTKNICSMLKAKP